MKEHKLFYKDVIETIHQCKNDVEALQIIANDFVLKERVKEILEKEMRNYKKFNLNPLCDRILKQL
jgi:hypothetical protein